TDPLQRQFGNYELLELIGEGGMGVVYRARQASLERDVAVKLLAAGPWASTEFVERFHREAQNAARMQHPNIVAIYEVGSAEELHFFSMRLINGSSLAAVVKREGRLPVARAAALMRTIAEAVDYAHRLGVLHLDLKPANVLIDDNGNPHVADFGLARRLDDGLAADSDEVSGTPSYMAPEQATAGARRITAATDIWGLGAILYELVTGQPPFLGESPQATLKLVVGDALRSPREINPSVPHDLEAIIRKCMVREVSARYASARALADDLGRFVDGREVSARPLNPPHRILRWAQREPKLAATALLALAALLTGLIATTQQWRRANANAKQSQTNAATSNERLWASRRDAALRLQQDGKGFEALTPLLANIDEQEHAGKIDGASIERHEVGAILNQGVVLINRMHLANAAQSSPFAAELSPDGSRFAIAMTDQTVHWYATDTLKELGHVDLLGLPDSTDGPELPILLRFVDNHRLRVTLDWFDFFTAPGDSDTFLIDLDHGGMVSFPDDFANLSDATFSADGRYAVLRNRADKIQYWQVVPWKPLSPLVEKGFDREIALLSRDGRDLIAIGNAQQDLNFFDPRTMAPTAHIALPPTQGLSA
ncbi:MAG: serine/threonine-protein kinase, partial [Rudaea sp.]